ncbi:hypothetical protein HGB13_01065 [bacterium]|nr:hypothetical protein [bacterium]
MKKLFKKNHNLKIFFIFLFSLFLSLTFLVSKVTAKPGDASEWGNSLKNAGADFDKWKEAYNSASDHGNRLLSWNIQDSSGNLIAPESGKPLYVGIPSNKGETWFKLVAFTSGGLNGWAYYFQNQDNPHWYIEYHDTFANSCTGYFTGGSTVPDPVGRPLVEGAMSWCNFSDTGFPEWIAANVVDGDTTKLTDILGVNETSVTEALKDSVLMNNLMELLTKFGQALGHVNNWILGMIEKLLIVDVNNDGVVRAWGAVRNAANIMLVVALLFIALFNSIRFQIDYYTAKALIPRLAIAAIMINFSFLISKGIIDFGNVFTNYFLTMTQFNNVLEMNAAQNLISGVVTIGGAIIAGVLLGWFALIIALIAIGILLAILFMRIGLLYVITAVSPMVFLFSVLPFTRDLTKQWWNYISRYAFMGAVISLVLFIASAI